MMKDQKKKIRKEQNYKPFPPVFSGLFLNNSNFNQTIFCSYIILFFFSSLSIVWHMNTVVGFLLLGGIPSRRILQLKRQDIVCFWGMEVQAWILFSSSFRDLHTLLPMARRLDPIIQFPGRKRWKCLDKAAIDHKALPANEADLPYKQLYIMQSINLPQVISSFPV